MDRLIAIANIENYRKLLAAATDEIAIKELKFLLAREEGRLIDAVHRERQITARR